MALKEIIEGLFNYFINSPNMPPSIISPDHSQPQGIIQTPFGISLPSSQVREVPMGSIVNVATGRISVISPPPKVGKK